MELEEKTFVHEVGKIFRPWRQFRRASILPNWLLQQQQVSPGAKLCYARLLQHCGRHEWAWPGIEKLAEEMGSSPRQVSRYLAELKKNKLIAVRRRGLGKSNEYCFLWHIWAEEERQQVLAAELNATERQLAEESFGRTSGSGTL